MWSLRCHVIEEGLRPFILPFCQEPCPTVCVNVFLLPVKIYSLGPLFLLSIVGCVASAPTLNLNNKLKQ